MERTEQSATTNTLAVAVAGMALVGACLGLRNGIDSMAWRTAVIPMAYFGIAAMTIPALYIGAAYLGAAPSAATVVNASKRALRNIGVVFLGTAPAIAFLMVSLDSTITAGILAFLVMGFGSAVGLRSFYTCVSRVERKGHALVMFLVWAGVSLQAGAHVLDKVVLYY